MFSFQKLLPDGFLSIFRETCMHVQRAMIGCQIGMHAFIVGEFVEVYRISPIERRAGPMEENFRRIGSVYSV